MAPMAATARPAPACRWRGAMGRASTGPLRRGDPVLGVSKERGSPEVLTHGGGFSTEGNWHHALEESMKNQDKLEESINIPWRGGTQLGFEEHQG
jgi:hypothetical protein